MKDKLPMSHIKVLQPGISSIQDEGRFGYLSEGIPVSGFMDSTAAGLANLLVGNSLNSACIEWGMLPPKLQFKEAAVIAITGARAKVYVNNLQVKSYKSLYIAKNAILSFGVVEDGVYGYISIQGGFKTLKILGSRSWFSQITAFKNFIKGMKIPFHLSQDIEISNTRLVDNNKKKLTNILEVYPGPEFDFLNKEQQHLLLYKSFSPSVHKNRMGIQLDGEFDEHKFSILSSPVLPGTVQWTPSGKLIVLMKDAQTVGGYPRLLQLSEKALNKLSQLDYPFSFEVKTNILN